MACVTRTMRDEALVEIAHVANTRGWGFTAGRSSVEIASDEAEQLWRIDAPWTPGATVSVAVRHEHWMLTAPTVRVEQVDGALMVVEGCRRFSVTTCEAGWHGGKACNGHPVVVHPDPFPFERFVASVVTGRIECAYLDNVIDPQDSPERRWGGWLWMPQEDVAVLAEWQGYTALERAAESAALPAVAHEPA